MESEKEKDLLRMQLTEDGLHLMDSVLWLDSHKNGELSFLSSALDSIKTLVPKIITTEETVKILECTQNRPNALICQYNRPFSLGRLRMELLPCGSVLGGSSIYVEKEHSSLIYAPSIQTEKIPFLRAAQFKQADTLVLNAHYPESFARKKSRKKERERLLSRVADCLNLKLYPIIFCQSVGTAQEVTQLLSEQNIPAIVHRNIFKINQIYESYGSQLGPYSLLSNRKVKSKVTILPSQINSKKLALQYKDRPIFYVEDACDPNPQEVETGPGECEKFFLNRLADLENLKEILEVVKPSEVYIYGPYAVRYMTKIKTFIPNTKVLFEQNQPPLL